MKTLKLLVWSLVGWVGFLGSLSAAEAMKHYAPKSNLNSKMRIEGTSNIHDWRSESSLLGGSLDVGAGFPPEPGQAVSPGKIEATATVTIAVTSFRSLKENGERYSEDMDKRMYAALKTDRIIYHLTELTLKEPAKSKDSPYLFEAAGELAVAGVTNKITMPVTVLPLEGKKLKISGTTTVKMTSFKIQPPSPPILEKLITTGDDVKLIFDWMLMERPAPAAK